jgi:Holliday junction resolvasome RuvABC endonuclease subunit
MKIVALDIATQTGVAVGDSGGNPKSWSVDLGKSLSQARRLSEVLRLTQELIETHAPDFVALEAAIGGRNASAYLIKLVGCVEAVCANRGVPCEAFHSGSIRKHFLGKAYTARDFPHFKVAAAKKAIKGLVMDRCRLLGWDVEDDNAADACALWDYVCANRARGYQARPVGGLFK